MTFSAWQRTKSVEMTRYLSKADSDIILAAFNQKAKKDATDNKKIRKPSQKKR